jgi:hypothetical protein
VGLEVDLVVGVVGMGIVAELRLWAGLDLYLYLGFVEGIYEMVR